MKESTPITRRAFIGQAACSGLSFAGLLSTIGTLRLFNATVSAQGGPPLDDSKILVCLFLYGGNDANNMLVPREQSAYDEYARDRGILALPRNTLLPLNLPGDDGRDFGLHPAMAPLQSIFNQQKMAIVCNVGTLVAPITKAEYLSGAAAVPPYLFSHNDQQVQWQTSVPDSPRKTGWGGRLADLLQSLNAGSQVSMNISIAGSNFFQVGEEVVQYHVTPQGSIGLSQYDANWTPIQQQYHAMDQMLGRSYGHLFEQEYANIINRAVANDTLLKTALSSVQDHTATFANSTLPTGGLNPVASQLRMILRLIEARQTLGMRRQIFFAALGGFDTHDAQLEDHHALLEQLSNAVADFHHGTEALGISDRVTLFTASDFNRTYNSNGKGSDHAWGGHHIVVGGAVNGGRLYGDMPILQIQGPSDTGTRGSWIPTVSTDEMAATLARWFGVSPTDLPLVLPNIGRFAQPDLGFMAT
ncbi:MAG TPA: DUF1501 domain-containing protein [Kiritimatiellia bacterium]|nr:DUF1501 domain-containing protein [Kiritimatiellia bacterium]HMP34288.1 DUF1501 domain-containing protein [Kiritimatiellia bacterium]